MPWPAASAEEALTLIEKRGLPQLGVFDVLMPGMSGFELYEALLTWCDLPVIVLTAVSDERTVRRGIRFPPTDYINKPFRPSEFLARVERVFRRFGRGEAVQGSVTEVDDRLSVDFIHQHALIDGEPVSLTPMENKLLYILMRKMGQSVSTELLSQRLYPDEEAYADVLRVHVQRLREKLERDPRKPVYLLSDGDAGYRFVRPAS